MLTRFDIAYALAAPAVLPWLAWRRHRRGKTQQSADGMLGRTLAGVDATVFHNGSLWVHAVSVGEVNAARVMIPGLRALRPELPLVVSTITETGQAIARSAFPHDHVTYFPFDFSTNVARFQRTFNPRVFVLLETELWPNFLTLARRRGTQCYMVNGKVSDRSFPRYLRARRVLAPAFEALAGVCTQTPADAERFAALGVPEARIRVTGNCKFDMPQQPLAAEERTALAAELGLGARGGDAGARRWIVAGSTHAPEEALLLDAFRAVLAAEPRAGLVLCPRHPDRFAEVAGLARAAGFRTLRSSEVAAGDGSTQGAAAEDAQVVVLDKMGVLARAYGLGEVAIVAGSFCPVGGHNLLEAAAHGVPVVFGPDLHSQREIDRLFKRHAAGLQVTPEALPATLIRLLADEGYRNEVGARCLEVVQANRGSAGQAIEAIRGWLTTS